MATLYSLYLHLAFQLIKGRLHVPAQRSGIPRSLSEVCMTEHFRHDINRHTLGKEERCSGSTTHVGMQIRNTDNLAYYFQVVVLLLIGNPRQAEIILLKQFNRRCKKLKHEIRVCLGSLGMIEHLSILLNAVGVIEGR